ncbi:uncharacterized protein LOC131634640 [Vicia villosa]|uniref:uncharacterized protein LOC131614159 n=1 Tax=Vicia villosa TaxID=3911 RepID=UPI00273CCC79|nr:uncharacterized protein LOC131614159 [Vicia villosa]XP_058761278.1 uncharacterized protein LOC131634640 [Vicia villosa]
MAENGSHEQVDQVSLTFLVDKEKSRVLFAEAGNDFVDALFSFFTLPLGTIARLVAEESNIEAVRFGSISSLYQSLKDLDQQYLWSHTCKKILLNPGNFMEEYWQSMKLNIADTVPKISYFFCENKACKIENRSCVSFIKNQKCICGKLLKQETARILYQLNSFVKVTSTFIIFDDLNMMPNVVGTSLNLLQKLGVNDVGTIDKQTFNVSKKEVLDIFKLSLISKTPLTEFIFKREQFVGGLDPRNQLEFWIGDVMEPFDEMVVKVVRRKSNGQIMYVEAEEDFADFIFSFLIIPLGRVLHMLKGFSFLSCIDSLYKSMTELSSDKGFRSSVVKDKLIKPTIQWEIQLRHQILPIHDHNLDRTNERVNFVDYKSPIAGGYVKSPLTIMVTDDLVVSPMSTISGVSYLEKLKVPFNDVEERTVRICRKEGLSILKASLTTTSALTNGLNLYIIEQLMNEQRALSIHKE